MAALLGGLAVAACAGGAGYVAAPELQRYSDAFQDRLAREMQRADGSPCSRIEPQDGCLAWKRVVIDHGTMRDKIRAAEDD